MPIILAVFPMMAGWRMRDCSLMSPLWSWFLLLQEHHSWAAKKTEWSFRQWDVRITRWPGYSSGKSVRAVCLSIECR